MVAGALTLAVAVGALIDSPFGSSLAAAAILLAVAILARSHLLMAVGPLALAAAIGASSGYWEACYTIAVREPTLTIALFSVLGFAAWKVARLLPGKASELALTFARMSVVLVNFGFWIGSLWGDVPSACGAIRNSPRRPIRKSRPSPLRSHGPLGRSPRAGGGPRTAGASWSTPPRPSARSTSTPNGSSGWAPVR